MVKIERSSVAPFSLAIEKAKGTKNYREQDVVLQLNADFHGKCYLCEIDELQSVEVEHLRAHRGTDRDLMFDWNNLFLCCPHCNNMKNRPIYEETILDCCQEDPEKVLDQELVDEHVVVTALADTVEATRTAELLTDCFEKKNTGIRILECQTRINALKTTMIVLYRALEAYKVNKTEKDLRVLRAMLNRSYKFAGFTRTYVRHHITEYPELALMVQI